MEILPLEEQNVVLSMAILPYKRGVKEKLRIALK